MILELWLMPSLVSLLPTVKHEWASNLLDRKMQIVIFTQIRTAIAFRSLENWRRRKEESRRGSDWISPFLPLRFFTSGAIPTANSMALKFQLEEEEDVVVWVIFPPGKILWTTWCFMVSNNFETPSIYGLDWRNLISFYVVIERCGWFFFDV